MSAATAVTVRCGASTVIVNGIYSRYFTQTYQGGYGDTYLLMIRTRPTPVRARHLRLYPTEQNGDRYLAWDVLGHAVGKTSEQWRTYTGREKMTNKCAFNTL